MNRWLAIAVSLLAAINVTAASLVAEGPSNLTDALLPVNLPLSRGSKHAHAGGAR